MSTALFLIAAATGCAGVPGGHPPNVLPRSAVFVSGTDGHDTYRIPVLVVTPGGDLLAFCEGRRESPRDTGPIDLLVKRSTDGGVTWSPQQSVWPDGSTGRRAVGNPCAVVDRETDTIWLAFCRDNRAIFISRSDDDGRTWAAPRDISTTVMRPGWGWVATGPGVGIQLARGEHAGRLVIPCHQRGAAHPGRWTRAHVMFSDDGGDSWRVGESMDYGYSEATVAELGSGELVAILRAHFTPEKNAGDLAGFRGISTSPDGGITWIPVRSERGLEDPGCLASLIAAPCSPAGGEDCLVYAGPASRETRRDLTVRISEDAGRSWPVRRLVQPGPAAYSSLALLPDGRVGLLFETGKESPYERIVLATFPIGWVDGSVGGRRPEPSGS